MLVWFRGMDERGGRGLFIGIAAAVIALGLVVMVIVRRSAPAPGPPPRQPPSSESDPGREIVDKFPTLVRVATPGDTCGQTGGSDKPRIYVHGIADKGRGEKLLPGLLTRLRCVLAKTPRFAVVPSDMAADAFAALPPRNGLYDIELSVVFDNEGEPGLALLTKGLHFGVFHGDHAAAVRRGRDNDLPREPDEMKRLERMLDRVTAELIAGPDLLTEDGITIGAVTSSDALPPATVIEIYKNQQRFGYCRNKAVATDAGPNGTVKVVVSVEPDGSLESKVAQATTGSEASECIARAFRSMKFPATKATFTVPIMISASKY